MKDTVSGRYRGNMSFDVVVNGHKIVLDSTRDAGGNNEGPRPKSLLLAALAGCTGMDVVSILKKMKIGFDDFRIEIDGNITEEHPKHFDRVHIKYILEGKEIPVDKVEMAINLSQEKYCGVSYSLKKAMDITWELIIVDQTKEKS